MKQAATFAILLVLSSIRPAVGQGVIPEHGSVEHEITAGTSHAYTIQLNEGDYVAGAVEQRGITVVATVYEPDGGRIRNFAGPRGGRVTFFFVAERPGTYRLELRAPAAEASSVAATQPERGTYQLTLTEKLSLEERLKPTLPQEHYRSRTIEDLRAQITRGDGDTERFWQRVTRSGTPLVEDIANDPRHVLVTFLWRGNNSTRSVGVWGIVFAGPPSDYVMRHLGDTDVWYLTLRLPVGARFTYGFSPNAPFAPDFGTPRFQQRVDRKSVV